MTPFLQLAFFLMVILLTAKLAGYLSIRLGQPSVLGELLVGVVLGPSLINLLHLPNLGNSDIETVIHQLGEIGVLLLMFIAGMELHINDLRRSAKASALAGILGVILPSLLGWGVGVLFRLDTAAAVFLGLTLGATSVSISAQTLMELGMLRSRVGLGLLGAAVFDDILVILLLSFFFAVIPSPAGPGEAAVASAGALGILLIIGKILLFFGVAAGFGIWVLPRLVKWVSTLPVSQNVLALAVIMVLAFALMAELIGGMAAITGAFLAGLMFARLPERDELEPRVSALAYGFFVPIFFVSIGLSVNVASAATGLWMAAAVILVAVIGKLVGAGLGARWAGFNWKESWQLGAGMISRGEVGLIIASVGIQNSLVNEVEFAAIVGMVIISTLITPPILRILMKKPAPSAMKRPKAQSPLPQDLDGPAAAQTPAGRNESEESDSPKPDKEQE
jgi:Kef-type K+ transport system membrane component KefB